MAETTDGKRVPTHEQVSAGGVVFRGGGDDAEIALIYIVPEKRWQLPKGLIDPGESTEEAALREVREEAGVTAAIVDPIESIEYWYYADRKGSRVRYHKFVHFFLMRYVSGDVADHDHEVEEARWTSIPDALEMLAFKSERDVVGKAAKQIRTLQQKA